MILLSHSQFWSQTLLVSFQRKAERFVSNLIYLRNKIDNVLLIFSGVYNYNIKVELPILL